MVNKTMIKHSATVFGLIMGIIIVIGIFTGMFLYLQQNAQDADIPVDSRYNDTYNKLQSVGGENGTLSNNINDIQNSFAKVTEAESTVQQAWNGMKGLGSVLKLPISLVSTAYQTFDALIINLDIIPPWVKVLATIGIIALGVILVLSILKGDSNLIK